MPNDVPARRPDASPPVGRAALDRVLARAAELQASSGDDAEGALTEAQLLELGKEVGLSPASLRQALAEERSRVHVAEEAGWAASLAGPAAATASRTVRGRPAELLAALDAWMDKEECLRVRRRFADRVTWEPRSDFMGNLTRGFSGKGKYLARAEEVAATAIALDGERTLIRLDADVSNDRRSRLRTGGMTAGVGVTAGGAVAVMAAAVPTVVVAAAAAVAVLPVAIGLAAGFMVVRGHRDNVRRTQLALEQVLDRLEHGDMRPKPPSLMNVLADAAAKALKPPSR